MVLKTVLANGVFDLLHYGHFLYLQAARAMGDRLIVSVTSDYSVRDEKGPDRPIFSQEQRIEMIRSLRFVDDVIIVDCALDALEMIKPNIFVKGEEYEFKIRNEDEEFCTENDIDIRFTRTIKYSSTELLKKL